MAYSYSEIRALVELFKVIPEEVHLVEDHLYDFSRCIKRGFLVTYCGGTAIATKIPATVFNAIDVVCGNDPRANNQTFHKSFSTVRDASLEQLIRDQLTNYFFSYGMELRGSQALNYVPVEELNLPEGLVPFDKLVIIRTLRNPEIIEIINDYARSAVSPSSQQVECFRHLIKYVTIPVTEIKSREFQCLKFDFDGTVPEDPEMLLRYLVYSTTSSTLLIKNEELIHAIKANSKPSLGRDNKRAYKILSKANLAELASIFFRYKPIFLAYKTWAGCAPIINRIRRLAEKYHQPQSDVTIKNFTTLARERRGEDMAAIISRASNRELIKLLNALQVRVFNPENGPIPGVFNIRNGRTYVRRDGINGVSSIDAESYNFAYIIIVGELIRRFYPILKNKKFYIPRYIDYAIPVSEKQFVGNIPWGSSINLANYGDTAFTVGIQWFDHNGIRTDIDLHLSSIDKHFGWNGSWREGSDILYTGDQTSAHFPHGAAEAYWFAPQDSSYLLFANLYWPRELKGCKYKLFFTHQNPKGQEGNYTYDATKSFFPPIPLEFTVSPGMNIGMFYGRNFYFYGGVVSNGIVPKKNNEDLIKGLEIKFKTSLTMKSFLCMMGAKVFGVIPEDSDDFIDLSPEALTASTLLDIVDGKI